MKFTIWEALFVLSILGNTVAAFGGTGVGQGSDLSPREIYERTAPAVVITGTETLDFILFNRFFSHRDPFTRLPVVQA